MMILLIKLSMIFSTVDYISSAVLENNTRSAKEYSKKRMIRSPNCGGGNCVSTVNINNTYHQIFHALVTFNEYVSSGCSSRCSGKNKNEGCSHKCSNETTANRRTASQGTTSTRRPNQHAANDETPNPDLDTTGAANAGTTTTTPPYREPTGPRRNISETRTNSSLAKKTFTVEFNTSTWGLDLYYLMDPTEAFDDDRAELVKTAARFTEELKKLSADLNLGFGIFGGKTNQLHVKQAQVGIYHEPRTTLSDGGQKKSRKGKTRSRNRRQVADKNESFGLWNELPLTGNTALFGTTVAATKRMNFKNNDILTALHQATTCTQLVGWRNNTRRFLILTTDKRFYKDGKQKEPRKGAMKFDGNCHLDNNGKFGGPTYDQMDCPSLDQVKDSVKNNEITVIFAIAAVTQSGIKSDGKSGIIELYQNLSNDITPTPQVLELDSKSENVTQIIQQAYRSVSDKMRLRATLIGSQTETKGVVYTIKCTDKNTNVGLDDENENSHSCKPQPNGVLSFKIKVTMNCTSKMKTNVAIIANVKGNTETRRIDLSSVCPS